MLRKCSSRFLQLEQMVTGCLLVALTGTSWAVDGDDCLTRDKRRLFHPTMQEVQAEEQGRVVIYDQMKPADIDQALEQEFERVESMMFVRILKTDPDGRPKVDPQTGSYEMEDDGCD